MSYEIETVRIKLVKGPSWFSEKPLNSARAVAEAMAKELAECDREMFCVLNCATDGKVINMNVVSMGTLNHSLVSAREVFKSSILSNAAHIIAVHNHPSGNVEPSLVDQLITQKLRDAGEVLGIELKDHVIVGGDKGEYFSFQEEEILWNDFREEQRKEMRDRYEVER